jgi:pimeloyl-ACP methyl ester carboxylesterase
MKAMKSGIASSGGVDLAYSVEGAGQETVLLIMGLGGRAADWGTEFPSLLAKQYRVVRMDNRGVGASPRFRGAYELSDLALDATHVLDAVGADRAHIIGISMGGMISQLVALEHPNRVQRLVLMSTHFGGANVPNPHPDAMRLFDPEELMQRGSDPERMMRFTLSVITGPGFLERRPDLVEMMIGNVRAAPTRNSAFMAQLQAILTSDRSERVKDIKAPTLVVHGSVDKLIPVESGRMLASAIPGAKLHLMENVGHCPMLEAPEELAKVIGEFLAG